MRPVHPQSGLHYVVVLPDDPGAYLDYWNGYSALRLPWLSVITVDEYRRSAGVLLDDDATFVVLWTIEQAPRPRKALVAAFYAEAVGEETAMLPDHVRHWNDFGRHAPEYDAIFVHTPGLVAPLRRGMSLPVHVVPAGWSPSWGSPSWNACKYDHLLYWGSTVGRRESIIPWIRLQSVPVRDASGCFGRAILAEIERSRAAIYVAHSIVQSFSTWRLWQMIATSTALIAEPGEAWPFVVGEHYLPIPYYGGSEESRRNIHDQVVRYFQDSNRLGRVARKAHEDLAERFTIERCVEDWLVPASVQVQEATRAR